jgi:hypothetical protein
MGYGEKEKGYGGWGMGDGEKRRGTGYRVQGMGYGGWGMGKI